MPGSLAVGELAINRADGLLYYANSSGAIVSLATKSGNNAKLDAIATFNGVLATFALASGGVSVTPASASSLLVSMNGVIQEPLVDFTVSGSNITFTDLPVSGDVFFGIHMTGSTSTSQVAVHEFRIGSAPANATGSNGTWTWAVPSTAKFIRIVTVSGGAGGGSGRRGATSTACGGGGGGGGADVKSIDLFASQLTSTQLYIVVGAGGAGAAGVTANDTNGNLGTTGGNTGVQYTDASGVQLIWHDSTGYRGDGGTTAGGVGRAGSWVHYAPGQHSIGGNGGDGVTAPGIATMASGTTAASPSAGGGGGGISAANAAQAGAAGFMPYRAQSGQGVYPLGGTSGGGVGGTGASNVFGHLGTVGVGGGGGGSSTTTAGGAGGNGGLPGGGGGAGGASRNGFTSGAGGNGGDGVVRIVVWS